MKHSENDPTMKLSYEAPKIVSISLRPEEAVLGNCKISASPGPHQSACAIPTSCMTIGS